MEIALASDCSKATITSTLIDDYVNGYPTGNEMVLTVTYQCEDTPTEIELDNTTLDFNNSNYVLLPDALGQSDTLCDGIYFFELVSTATNGSSQTEWYCLFVDCKTKCLLIPYVADNIESNPQNVCLITGLYDRLTDISTCSRPECECDDGCVIYNKIVDLLNSYSSSTGVKTNGCGCN